MYTSLKERFLGEDEIIENLVVSHLYTLLATQSSKKNLTHQHNPTNTICWTIHRPNRGWYIRIRSPGFPPGFFIPLIPVPKTAQYHTEAALSFSCRTNVPGATVQLNNTEEKIHDDDDHGGDSTMIQAASSSAAATSASIHHHHHHHSYPPSPSTSRSNSISQCSSLVKPPPTQITQFVLAPSSIPPLQQRQQQSANNTSFFARAFSMLKSHQPSHSSSFTLSRLLAPNPLSSPPPYASSVPLTLEVASTDNNAPLPLHPPLLVFHDRTPFLTVRTLTGLIEIDDPEEQLLGVDTSFWIAIVLTYLEFLEEREVSDILFVLTCKPKS